MSAPLRRQNQPLSDETLTENGQSKQLDPWNTACAPVSGPRSSLGPKTALLTINPRKERNKVRKGRTCSPEGDNDGEDAGPDGHERDCNEERRCYRSHLSDEIAMIKYMYITLLSLGRGEARTT